MQCFGQKNVVYRRTYNAFGQNNVVYRRTYNALVKRTSYIEEGHTMHWSKERRI